jgi:hypothetical protein
VRNDPATMQKMRQRMEIVQMNRTIRQMKNELTRLRRGENFVLNSRILSQEQRRNPILEKRVRNDEKNEEYRQMTPRVPNPNDVVLEEIFEDENLDNFDQEVDIVQDEILEYDEGESSLYIFDEQE